MRIGIITLIHESNTYLVTPTTYDMFQRGMRRGDEMRQYYMDSNDEVRGFIEGVEAAGWEAVCLYAATTVPSGRITRDCCERLIKDVENAINEGGTFDGMLLAPHGANSGEDEYRDLDGVWMSRVRELVGDIPVMATIDPHANLSEKMIGAVDAMIAYRTNPHLDQHAVGRQASDLLVRTLKGECKPTMAASYPPVAINIERQHTPEEPCLSLYRLADNILDDDQVLSNSVVLGFPYTDTEEMGSAFIVVTDDDMTAAEAHAQTLSDYLVDHRDDFAGKFTEIDEALEMVGTSPGPVCLLDMGDNVGGGSAADGTILARALEAAGIKSYVCIYDPECAAAAKAAGVGATIDLTIGGKTDDLHGEPLELSVTVRGLYDGKYTESEVRHGGRSEFDMGETAIVETANGLCISLTSYRVVPFSLGMVLSCDLDPADFDVLVAKGVNAPVAAFAPVCPTLIRVNTKGSTSADMTSFEFNHRRRPLYPFEEIDVKG